MPGGRSAPLPAQAKGTPAQGPVGKSTASTGEQAASSGRQLSYAEAGKAYAGLVAGRPVQGATAGVDSSTNQPTKRLTKGEVRRRRETSSLAGSNHSCVRNALLEMVNGVLN
jgi:hypothetical protein